MANQSSPQAGVSYKFQCDIENLNGANPDPVVLDSWRLTGCYIANLVYNETNYASGGEYQTISAQIRYDSAEHIVGSIDNLSGPSFQVETNSQAGSTS